MTRDDPTARLISIIQRVPVLAIDTDAARCAGDHAAVAYAQAIAEWRAEAAEAITQAHESSPSLSRYAVPDAFERIAAASSLMRAPVEA